MFGGGGQQRLRARHVAAAQQSQHRVHVVEGVVAGMCHRIGPVAGQRLPAAAHVTAEQVHAPQQRGAVQPLQVDRRGAAGDVRIEQRQCGRGVQRLEPEQRQMPPEVNRQAVVVGPVGAAFLQPGRALRVAALHFHHVRHRVNGPGAAWVARQRFAPGRLGL